MFLGSSDRSLTPIKIGNKTTLLCLGQTQQKDYRLIYKYRYKTVPTSVSVLIYVKPFELSLAHS